MAAPCWFTHPASDGHDVPGHPERPQRLAAIYDALAAADWFGWDRMESPAATREQLLRVHPASHLDAIESLAARGGGALDADTVCVPGTWAAVQHAAGGAVALVDALAGGTALAGFALHRPPGHHAEPERAMGFCYVNHVAVAAEHARVAHGIERVMIVDFDVHHGNGTEAVFWERPDVLFTSIHQSPLYPGTGAAGDAGAGAGTGYTVNLPVPPGSGDATWASLVEHVVVPLARAYAPGLILVSAGFDAHHLDPLANCAVTEAGYAAMTASLRRVAAELGVPLGFVLEGGYSTAALAGSVAAVAPVLGSAAVPAPVAVPRDRLAGLALARLAGGAWPGLAPTA